MKKQEKDLIFAAALVRMRLDLPLRNAKAVQKKDVAKEAGVNLGSYSQAENGIIPGEKVLIRIARYFKVSEETLLHPPGEEVPILKGIEGGGLESQDKEGLFGKTRHIKVEGAGFAVTTHEPKNQTTENQAMATLVEMLHAKEMQLSEQTMEIENLKALCNEMKARISALEAKPTENNPGGELAEEYGEKKAV